MNNFPKIYLSPPNVDHLEIENVVKALKSGWISPYGSYIQEFSSKLSQYFNKKVLLTNSGTSALHFALKLAEILKKERGIYRQNSSNMRLMI